MMTMMMFVIFVSHRYNHYCVEYAVNNLYQLYIILYTLLLFLFVLLQITGTPDALFDMDSSNSNFATLDSPNTSANLDSSGGHFSQLSEANLDFLNMDSDNIKLENIPSLNIEPEYSTSVNEVSNNGGVKPI